MIEQPNIFSRIIKSMGMLLALPVICLTIGVICTIVTLVWSGTSDFIQWRRSTSPLPPPIQTDLCGKFSLSPKDRLCTSDNILAPEFYLVISETFSIGETTYEDIEAILSDYQWKFEPREYTEDGQKFRVWYDLRGDRTYAIVFNFDEEGILYSMFEYYEGIE